MGTLQVGGTTLATKNSSTGKVDLHDTNIHFPAGAVIKKTYYSIGRGTMASDSFPNDDTVPQRDEGAEIFSQAYTPSTTSCTILITTYVRLGESSNVNAGMQLGLFMKDLGDASLHMDALIVGENLNNASTNPNGGNITLMCSITSWSGARTLSLRSSGGNTFNYATEDTAFASQKFGSAFTSAFIVEEIAT